MSAYQIITGVKRLDKVHVTVLTAPSRLNNKTFLDTIPSEHSALCLPVYQSPQRMVTPDEGKLAQTTPVTIF